MTKVTTTHQKFEVLRLYRDEKYTMKQIGETLHLDPKTVRKYLKPFLTEDELTQLKRRQPTTVPEEKIQEAVDIFNASNLTLGEVGDMLEIPRSTMSKLVTPRLDKDEVKRRGRNAVALKLSEHHAKRIVEPYQDHYGYWHVEAPDWYTGRVHHRRVAEHILVYCETHGLTELPKDYEVHHKNFRKTDNRPQNLELLHKYAHARLHLEHDRCKQTGQRT